MRAIRATAPGSARTQVGAVRGQLGARLAGGEFREHRAGELDQLDRLGAQLDAGVEAAEIEQLGGELAEPVGLPERPPQLVARLGQVGVLVRELLGRAVQHQPQRGQRRAQLVRGGAHERPARLLLRRQAPLHRPERAGEVADLVAVAVVDRRRAVGSALGHPQRGAAQRRQPPHEPGGESDAGDERDRQRDERGGHERPADHRLNAAEAVERAPHVEHAACAAGLERDGHLGLAPARFAAQPRDDAFLLQRPGHLREVIVSVEVRPGQHARAGVEHEHLAAGLAAQGGDGPLELRRPRTQLASVEGLERRAGCARRLLERRDRVLLELAVERDEHQQRRDGQRQRAHGDERRGEAPAQAEQLAHGACSR